MDGWLVESEPRILPLKYTFFHCHTIQAGQTKMASKLCWRMRLLLLIWFYKFKPQIVEKSVYGE
jgi:hypothetical protein